MTDPMLTSIATALAGKTATTLAACGRKALAALYEAIKEKFSGSAKSTEVLGNSSTKSNEHSTAALTKELIKAVEQDPLFAERLKALWSKASTEINAEADVVNTVTGKVLGHVVQAHDISGGISFGSFNAGSADIPAQREEVEGSATARK